MIANFAEIKESSLSLAVAIASLMAAGHLASPRRPFQFAQPRDHYFRGGSDDISASVNPGRKGRQLGRDQAIGIGNRNDVSSVHAEHPRTLQAQLDEERRALQVLTPLGQRLVGATEALKKSRRRRLQAEGALQLALFNLGQAKSEEGRLQAELTELESIFGQDTALASPLEALEEQLSAAVEQVTRIALLALGVAVEAQQQSAELLAKFRSILKAEETVAQKLQSREPPASARISGKTLASVVAEKAAIAAEQAAINSTPPAHRIVGKQTVQSHLSHFWGPPIQ